MNQNKIKKEESKYLTEIFNYLSQEFTEKDLENCQKAFTKFVEKLNLDKLSLLRKGEVMLRKLFI